MAPLMQIHLFGSLRVTLDNEPVKGLHAARLQALLAYLLLHRQTALTRQQIAFLFWPETPDAQAQTNLRQLLHTLRRRLPEAERCLAIGDKSVHWRSDAPAQLDVATFEDALLRSQGAGEAEQLAALAAAVAAYSGDLLPDCYDDWILPERERLAQGCLTALERLVLLHEERRELAAAIAYAQRLLRHDPLHEATYRRLMRLHALHGDRGAALRVYHTCVSALQQELGISPSTRTREAYEWLLHRDERQDLPARTAAPALAGRQREWQQLQRIWRKVNAGGPHMVCLAGEVGIGKTRLAEEMLVWAQQQGILTVSARAYAAEGRLAYAAIAECLAANALQPTIAQMDDVWVSELARLRPELLAAHPHLARPEPLVDAWQRHHLFEALARVFVVKGRPLLLLLDDLQWLAEETLQWLHYLLRFDVQARLLVLGTLRPEEVGGDHPLAALLLALLSADQLTQMELARLNVEETAELAGQIAQDHLDAATVQQLFRVTEGNPLFVVETVRAGFAGPAAQPSALSALPPKVQATIEARLAQLTPVAQELVAVAAVIGRSFTFDILTAVCEQGELQAVHSLDELWQRHMVVEQGIDAYDFTHDRIREVAYLQISPARRRLLHRRVAANLEKLAGGAPADALCMQLAHHCEQGGNTERAIFWLQQAANAARAVFAHQDAVNLLEHALPLLKQLPGSSHRLEIELELQLTLCNTLDALSSHLGDQIEAAYLRALALCRQVTHTPHLFRVLWGLHEIALYRGAYHDSLRLALECLQIAEAADDAAMMVQAHHAAWGPYFYTGRYDEMQVHIIGALAVYCQELHEATSTYYGVHDAASCGLTLFSLALWNMGRLDQSADWLDRGIAHARSLAIPANVADALGYCALICQLLRDPQRAQEFAEPALHIFTQQAMHNASYLSAITLGWSLAMQGQVAEGVSLARQGINLCRQSHHRLHLSQLTCMFGEACLAAGHAGEALEALEEGIDSFHHFRDLLCAPDLYLLKARALRALDGGEERVEAACEAALVLARELGSKVSELRAATDLAHLRRRQGRGADAHLLLHPVYSSFVEGLHTPDLLAAASLLAELAISPSEPEA